MQRPLCQDSFSADSAWEFAALVSVLSALLHAHLRAKAFDNVHQHLLLLQASVQLTTLPCVI